MSLLRVAGAAAGRGGKTRAALVPRLTARVVALHGYTCPAVVAVPVCGGNLDYLAWIDEQTR